jgi:homeobox protein cut-like
MAQRDRLRARCESWSRTTLQRELQAQVQASESLKADNTKLYEKVRYLQNYNKAPPIAAAVLQSQLGGADRDLT